MEATNTSLVRLAAAFLAEKRTERLLDYMVRGRPLAGVGDPALGTQWVVVYRAVMAAGDQRRETELMDLRSEFDLRGREPPMHLLSAEAATFTERFLRQVLESEPDPEGSERMDAMLDDLQERLSRPKH